MLEQSGRRFVGEIGKLLRMPSRETKRVEVVFKANNAERGRDSGRGHFFATRYRSHRIRAGAEPDVPKHQFARCVLISQTLGKMRLFYINSPRLFQRRRP